VATLAIAMPGLDRLPDGPVREFVSAVHELYDAAGQPASRVIARATSDLPPSFDVVSHETVSATLRGSTVPAWEKVRSILWVLRSRAAYASDIGVPEQKWSLLWKAARHELQSVPVADPDRSAPSAPLPVRAHPPPSVVPAAPAPPRPVPGFVGRRWLLQSMDAALAAGPDVRVVLDGPVGVGKTHAVLAYLDRHATDRPVWWVPCRTEDTALASLLELAALLGVGGRHRAGRAVEAVLSELDHRRYPYLMVYDGLDDPGLLRLVPSGGHVVITTRDPALGDDGSAAGLKVPDLDHDEVDVLLRASVPDLDSERVRAVVEVYGRTPLAIQQVLARWRETGAPIGVVDGVDAADSLITAPLDGYGLNASAALILALNRLERERPEALTLLETLSCLAPVPVAKQLLPVRDVPAVAGDGLPRGEVALNELIVALRRHGLVRLTDDGGRVEVLPLVRLVVRRGLSGDDESAVMSRARALLVAADPGWPDDQSSADVYREIGAHVAATGLVRSTDIAARQAVHHQIRFRYLAGDSGAAAQLAEEAYRTWQAGNDPAADDHLLLRITHEWANALRALGDYERAADLTRSAMSQLRHDPDYGDSHPYVLALAGGRASDLRIAGDYRRAWEVDEETLQLSWTVFGENHPRTTMSLHNLAISMRANGEFVKAEATDRVALRRHTDMFGAENWRTLLSVNALAEDLDGQGRYEDVLTEVGPLAERFRSSSRVRGNRGLLLVQRSLALALRGMGRLAEALEMLETVYAECAALFGDRHENTLAIRMSRANTLHLLGRSGDAAEAAQSVYEDYSRLVGRHNPLTVAAEINLATALRALGEHQRALRIDIAGGEVLLDRVGRDHPFTVAAAVNLASDYASVGHPFRLDASRRAVATAVRAHVRRDHPDVLAAEANLALDVAISDPANAARRREQVRRQVVSRFGRDHYYAVTVARGQRLDCVLEVTSA
jgi:tetratricopeptide (TPR) repeat protein